MFGQPRQHDANQHVGVFRLIETHLSDQPQPQPTYQRLLWLTGLPSLHFKTSASWSSGIYFLDIRFSHITQRAKITTITLSIYQRATYLCAQGVGYRMGTPQILTLEDPMCGKCGSSRYQHVGLGARLWDSQRTTKYDKYKWGPGQWNYDISAINHNMQGGRKTISCR